MVKISCFLRLYYVLNFENQLLFLLLVEGVEGGRWERGRC